MNHIFTKKKFYSIIKLVFCLIIVFLISPSLIFPQTNEQQKPKPPDPSLHHEVKDDNYIQVDRESQGRSPAYNYSMSNITTVQVNVDQNGQNIVGDAANETSISVNPNNRNMMAIGWRQFNTVNSNFRQAGYGFTTDRGQTWTFPGVIQPGIFRSDPVLDYDIDGNFYYNSLTNDPDYYCKVFKSSNGGSSWDNGTDAFGGDKQWMTIDKTDGPGSGHIYAFWTSYFSTCYPGFFTRSTNGGGSYENCITIPDDPYWGTLMVGFNGHLFVGGASGSTYDFVVARSTNAQISGQTVIWDMYTNVSLDGSITYGIGPNPGGLGGQTSIAVDTSGGPYNGNVYLLCTVERNSNPDPADVMFARSTNGGVNWSSPVKVNDDVGTSSYQWFGTMSVAPTGRIDVIWLDTRDNPGTYLSALYYSNSTDGGVTWSQNERLSDFFNPHIGWPQQDKMGDYFHMVSDSDGASLAWAATFNNEQDVYYSYITPAITNQTFQLSVNIANGWNMVSAPGTNPAGMGVSTWWPNLTGTVWGFNGIQYVPQTIATPGEGYWMENTVGETYNYPSIEIVAHDPIPVTTSWNMIGGYETSPLITSLDTDPTGQITGTVWEFNGIQYLPATNLVPGYGYWVEVLSDCNIIIPTTLLSKGSGEVVELFKEDWGRITLTGAEGKSYTLYAVKGDSPDGGTSVDLNQYNMPPLPPSGSFDIRFSSGRIAEDINSSMQSIDLTGVTYPLTVRVDGMDIRLQDALGSVVNVNLKSGEDVVIGEATVQKLMVTGEVIPTVYALEQNYPNPFNPNTTIEFSIPEKGTVNLSVYNILGERVKELKNEKMKPGYYEVKFDASALASGVYLYRIKAGDFIETKKMVLMK